MRVPLSWLKDYVEITISAEELAERLTLAGLEVKSLTYLGVPQGVAPEGINVPPSDHLVWDREKIVLGAIREVKAHPDADKLVLAMVDYGGPQPEQVVTGAPNLYPYKGKGPLSTPLLTPLAKEGAEVFDGHKEGQHRMVLKERSLRGIPNRCMVCSAKELGLEDEVDGILLLEPDSFPNAKPGTPIADILGDVIFEIDILPNTARAFGIIGVAREAAALTGKTLKEPSYTAHMSGKPITEAVTVEIRNAALNPRFCAMLIRDVKIRPAPQWMRRRLQAVGTRAINNIVDITNYIMFETGQPLHAFDYDVLGKRAGGKTPTLITRTASNGEKLTTLDGVERTFDDQAVMVCDSKGILALGGIMGGAESEIQPDTRNVLLEGASWNYINIRRTMSVQKMGTEAGTRFSRGVHAAQAPRAVGRAAEFMRTLGEGTVDNGMIDLYPAPAPALTIDFPLAEIDRLAGISLNAEEVIGILERLQFGVRRLDAKVLQVTVPDHRVDVGSGVIGIYDIVEEITRIYGYDRIPNTLIEDMLPPQSNNDELAREEMVRDLLTQADLREVINYRLTTPEAEARLQAGEATASTPDYVRLANPISAERTVLRRTLLDGLLTNVAQNLLTQKRVMLFEVGAVFLPKAGHKLPEEPRRLSLAISGLRHLADWQDAEKDSRHLPKVDFFDLKGILNALVSKLRLPALTYKNEASPAFHPGRCAGVYLRGAPIGFIGEIHPLVQAAYGVEQAVIAAELDMEALIADLPRIDRIRPLPTQPAIYQDMALVVKESITAAEAEAVIRKAGGPLLADVQLFDVYRGEPIPAGQKSLAYALTYQADRTLTDQEVAKVHQKIAKAAEREIGASLRT
jgi:phenylalanyl-tRNA synthetase beta chain